MTTTATDLTTVPPVDRAEGVALGRVAYRRLADDLAALDPADWDLPTDCDGWTVRDLAGHVLGAMRSAASLRATARLQRAVKRRARATGEREVDAMSALQVEANADLTPTEVVAAMQELVDRAADGRARLPEVVAGRVRIPVEMPGIEERWTLSYLLGPILTRDAWLHRVADVAGATGRPTALDAEHDGRIVADVVAEWARRHGRPVELTVTGPAGGRFTAGTGGPALEVDAVALCRMLSGRAEPTHELFAVATPF